MPAETFVSRLNEQIANEFAAHQQYVACAVYYDAETLPQLARFFYRQAMEERDHAMMMVQYLIDADAEVTIPGVAAPQTTFADIVEPVALALAQEQRVSEQINGLTATAREAAAPVWERHVAHPFVAGIGDGTLPEDRFRFYVRQDYLFLIDYGRLLALAAARAPRLAWMRRFSALAQSVLETEMDLHRQFAARWGVTTEQLESERTAPATD